MMYTSKHLVQFQEKKRQELLELEAQLKAEEREMMAPPSKQARLEGIDPMEDQCQDGMPEQLPQPGYSAAAPVPTAICMAPMEATSTDGINSQSSFAKTVTSLPIPSPATFLPDNSGFGTIQPLGSVLLPPLQDGSTGMPQTLTFNLGLGGQMGDQNMFTVPIPIPPNIQLLPANQGGVTMAADSQDATQDMNSSTME